MLSHHNLFPLGLENNFTDFLFHQKKQFNSVNEPETVINITFLIGIEVLTFLNNLLTVLYYIILTVLHNTVVISVFCVSPCCSSHQRTYQDSNYFDVLVNFIYSSSLKLNKTKTVNSNQYSSRKQDRMKGFQQTAKV